MALASPSVPRSLSSPSVPQSLSSPSVSQSLSSPSVSQSLASPSVAKHPPRDALSAQRLPAELVLPLSVGPCQRAPASGPLPMGSCRIRAETARPAGPCCLCPGHSAAAAATRLPHVWRGERVAEKKLLHDLVLARGTQAGIAKERRSNALKQGRCASKALRQGPRTQRQSRRGGRRCSWAGGHLAPSLGREETRGLSQARAGETVLS